MCLVKHDLDFEPDDFYYYVCCEYIVMKNRNSITKYVSQFYVVYFGIKLRDKSKTPAPYKICVERFNDLCPWFKRKILF